MDMEQIRKESLMTKVQLFGKLWGNKQLQEVVYQAIEKNDMVTLVDAIDKIAIIANEQKERIDRQGNLIRALQKEIAETSDALTSQKKTMSGMMKPPALKEDLETQKMWSLYQRYGSFSKVGNLMGCAGKTVSRRLRNAGYLV